MSAQPFMPDPDWPSIGTLATEKWGPPNRGQSSRDDIRFGTNGSKSVKPSANTWHDHEAGIGGGYRDLYKLARGTYPGNGAADHDTGFRIPANMAVNSASRCSGGITTGQTNASSHASLVSSHPVPKRPIANVDQTAIAGYGGRRTSRSHFTGSPRYWQRPLDPRSTSPKARSTPTCYTIGACSRPPIPAGPRNSCHDTR
jgi:hypothetical protein